MTDSLLIAVHAFASRILMSFLVEETLLLRQVNLSTSFREPPYSVEISPLWWRCPWCNGYRRRIWTRQYEFKSWTRLMAFHIALIPSEFKPVKLHLKIDLESYPARAEGLVNIDITTLIKAHVLRFVCIHMEVYAAYCLLQTMQQGFSLGRCIYQKHYVISVVNVNNNLWGLWSASYLSQCKVIFFH